MPVPVPQTIEQLTAQFLATYCATANPAFGFTPGNIPQGDPAIALGFATAGLAVAEQKQIQDLYAFSRASTSTGTDLISWFADFGYIPNEGNEATSTVTIPTSTGQAAGSNIPVPQGTIIQTQPIVLAPSVVPAVYQFETSSTATIIAGQTSVTVGITATQVGSSYNNIPSNTPLQLGTAVPGAGAPAFASPIAGGTDAPTAAQMRADFIQYIDSLQLGTLAAITAAVEEATGYQSGINLVVQDYAVNPALILPGQIFTILIYPGSAGQYTGLTDNPTADAALNAMILSEAFGATPYVWFANQYAVTAISITYTYSQSQMTAAQLNPNDLQSMVTAYLQALFPQTGSSLGAKVPFSQVARAILDMTATTSAGVITGLFTDVNVYQMSFTTQLDSDPSYTFAGSNGMIDSVFAGVPTAQDLIGYLSMTDSIIPTYTAIAGP